MYPFTINCLLLSFSAHQILSFFLQGILCVEEFIHRLNVYVTCTVSGNHIRSFLSRQVRYVDHVICDAIKVPRILFPYDNIVLYYSHVFSKILRETGFKKCLSSEFRVLQATGLSNV